MATTDKKYKNKPQSDLSLAILVGLAILAIPRVVVHDLRLLEFDSAPYTFLAVAPFIVWLGFAVFRKYKHPFYTFFLLGLVFGVLLAITHQLTWAVSWGDNPPHLGGNLEGQLAPWLESFILRIGALFSSLITGVFIGVIYGAVAILIAKFKQRHRT